MGCVSPYSQRLRGFRRLRRRGRYRQEPAVKHVDRTVGNTPLVSLRAHQRKRTLVTEFAATAWGDDLQLAAAQDTESTEVCEPGDKLQRNLGRTCADLGLTV